MNEKEKDEPEDIPSWQISFMRQLLRVCSQPGHYIVFIDVGWDRERSWTYRMSMVHPLLTAAREEGKEDG